ncbi:EF-hand, partial [Rhizodiscina lignyota]
MQTIAGQQPTGTALTQLLYHISEDRARQDGYVHRGVGCNACDMYPIHGVRWHCINCADYDLCSDCEAQGQHTKTHLFIKINIPAPYLGSPRQMQPVIYPGEPGMLPRALPQDLRRRLVEETKFDPEELNALYDQFTCLANVHPWEGDPNELGAAIDANSFNRAFLPSWISPPKDNFVYRRYFTFFDSNDDGCIGFEEFVAGLSIQSLKQGYLRKLQAVFNGYDEDGDGYISRKDCLHMFRSHFIIKLQITRDHLMLEEEELHLLLERNRIDGSQPLNSIF